MYLELDIYHIRKESLISGSDNCLNQEVIVDWLSSLNITITMSTGGNLFNTFECNHSSTGVDDKVVSWCSIFKIVR